MSAEDLGMVSSQSAAAGRSGTRSRIVRRPRPVALHREPVVRDQSVRPADPGVGRRPLAGCGRGGRLHPRAPGLPRAADGSAADGVTSAPTPDELDGRWLTSR